MKHQPISSAAGASTPPLERQHTARRRLAATIGLAGILVLLWLPIWIGPYPALYDYPAHLFEVQLALNYNNPQLAYSEGFVARPNWFAESNALITLAISGLTPFTTLDRAGQLALSLSLAIFLCGLYGLLHRAGTAGMLLGLAPLLAYNFTFTSGWLNFNLALGLALCAISSYEEWRQRQRRHSLLWLALLIVLIYSAHLFVWGLLALTLGVRAAAERLTAGQLRALLLSSSGPLILILATRPILALILLIGPIAWCGTWLIERLARSAPADRLRRRFGLSYRRIALAIGLLSGLLFGLMLLAEPWLQRLQPDLDYAPFPRISFPIRSFTLAQQLPTIDPILSGANLLLSLLLPLIGGLALYGTRRNTSGALGPRLAPLGALALLYALVPSYAADIAVVEPRILIWMLLLGLPLLRLPANPVLRRSIAGLSLTAGLIAIGAFSNHSLLYQRQAATWRSSLAQLQPARSMLVLARSEPYRAALPLRLIESYYDGRYFSTRYQLEWGGFTTRMFGNGPVYLRPDLEIGAFVWKPSEQAPPQANACTYSRPLFDAVVAWGPLRPELQRGLDACFGPGEQHGDLHLWRR